MLARKYARAHRPRNQGAQPLASSNPGVTSTRRVHPSEAKSPAIDKEYICTLYDSLIPSSTTIEKLPQQVLGVNKANFFSKSKTGGSNASYGYDYQDHCVMLFLLQHCGNPTFEAVGIETDDDFCLLFKERKIACQVKNETLTVPLAKYQIGDDKLLIGSTVNQELRSFWRYLQHFRNQQSSPESEASKITVSREFASVLKKHGFDQARIDSIPHSWSITIIQEDGLEQRVAAELIVQGVAHQLCIDNDNCLHELYRKVAAARKNRSYISGHEVLALLKKHGRSFASFTGHSSQLDFLHRMKIDPHQLLQSVDGKLSSAQRALKDERYNEALDIYLALANAFESEQLLVNCAALFQMVGNHDEALLYCDKALKLAPSCGESLAIKGTLYADRGDPDLALELLCAANAKKPGDPFILYNVGVAHMQLKNLEEAADFFEQTIEADPNLYSAHLNRAVCLYELCSFSQSLEHVERALILHPGQPQALSHKGELKRFYGDYDAALKLFERCLQTTPDNPVAKRGQAFCLIEKGDRLGYALLVLAYKEELRELTIGKSMGVLQIGWERTLAISINNVDGASYKIECDGLEIYVPIVDNSFIGIGVVGNEDESPIPIIVKSYENPDAFIFATNAIAENVKDDNPISVTGSVQNHKDHREIRIEFPRYTIYGKTDPGAQEGFNKFCEVYNGVVWLILECGQSLVQWQVPLTGLILKR